MTSLPSLGEFVRDGLYVQGKSLMSFVCVCSGLQGGSENGRYGYMMTFSIAYLRVSVHVTVT